MRHEYSKHQLGNACTICGCGPLWHGHRPAGRKTVRVQREDVSEATCGDAEVIEVMKGDTTAAILFRGPGEPTEEDRTFAKAYQATRDLGDLVGSFDKVTRSDFAAVWSRLQEAMDELKMYHPE
jgi:hypothetical protein